MWTIFFSHDLKTHNVRRITPYITDVLAWLRCRVHLGWHFLFLFFFVSHLPGLASCSPWLFPFVPLRPVHECAVHHHEPASFCETPMPAFRPVTSLSPSKLCRTSRRSQTTVYPSITLTWHDKGGFQEEARKGEEQNILWKARCLRRISQFAVWFAPVSAQCG